MQQVQTLLDDKDGKRVKTKKFLEVAKRHSQDIRLHTDADVDNSGANPSYNRFLRRVDGYLIEQKAKVFRKYHRFPMSTTSLCSFVLQKFAKVFDGKNATRSLSYTNERVEHIFNDYLSKTKFHFNWRANSLRELASGVNSIIVVDMPIDEPNPYYYFLSVESVLDFDVAPDGKIIWVCFISGKKELTFISKDGWQKFTTDEAGKTLTGVLSEVANDFGIEELCRFWWANDLNNGNSIIKKSPFSEWVSKLDWLEVWSTWKRMLDAFGSNPVMWTIQEDCGFEDKGRGVFCDGGYLKNRANNMFVRGESSSVNDGYALCPKCSEKRFVGPGSIMEIPAPDKETDMRAPFGIVPIEKTALDNAREEEQRLKDEITLGITGGGTEPLNKEAMNMDQIAALFEGWTAVLRQVKVSFESTEKWLLESMSALMFGGNVLECFVNYGNDFYLMSEQEALTFYVEARKLGVPDYILDVLLNEYYKTKFKFDAKGYERVKVLMAIEPFKHLTKNDIIGLLKGSSIALNPDDVFLKLNFGSLVQRFETENGNIADFGINMTPARDGDVFSLRVNAIKKTLMGYIGESRVEPVEPPTPPEPVLN